MKNLLIKLIIIILLSKDNTVSALATIVGSFTSSLLPSFPSFPLQNTTHDVTKECRAPLLYGPKDPTTNICLDNCCLACPYLNNFYKDLDYTYKIFTSLGIFSFFLSVLVCIIFIVLPSQRQNPTTIKILFPFALSVTFYEASQLFSIKQETLVIK